MVINLSENSLNVVRTTLEILKDQKQLESALATIDARTKAAEDAVGGAAKLKVADEQMKEAQKLLDEAKKKREESDAYALKRRADADDHFLKREQNVKASEKKLEKAEQEFNVECNTKRKELESRQVELVNAEEVVRNQKAHNDELRKMLDTELAAVVENNKKLSEAMSKLGIK